MAMGRPEKYHESFIEIAEEFLSQGYTVTALAGELGATKMSLHRWIDKYPEFRDAIERGKMRGQKRIEKLLMAKISGQNIKGFDSRKSDTACLIFMLKTRFHKDFSEKQQIEHSAAPAIEVIGWDNDAIEED